MELSRQEQGELVKRIVEGDNRAFEIFQKQYGAIIILHAKKYIAKVEYITFGMYAFEDLVQEIWWFILKNMPKYDCTKSTIVTWLYLMCPSRPSRIIRDMGNTYNHPGEDYGYMDSIDSVIYESSGDKDITLLDMLVDPRESLESNILNDILIHEYIFILKQFITGMNYHQRLVYIHMLKGLRQQESANIIGTTQVQVSRIRKSLHHKLMIFKDKIGRINMKDADKFAITLLSSNDEDKLADELDCDLAVIKICREILMMVDMYKGD